MRYILTILFFSSLFANAQTVIYKRGHNAVMRNGGLAAKASPVEVLDKYRGWDSVIMADRFGVVNTKTAAQNRAALQAAANYLATLPAATKKVFVLPHNDKIAIDGLVTFNALENFTWDMNGCLVSDSIYINPNYYNLSLYGHSSQITGVGKMFRFAPTTRFTDQAVITSDIVPGTNTFMVSLSTAATIQIGDAIAVTSNKSSWSNAGLKMGYQKIVTAKDRATGLITVRDNFVGDSVLKLSTDALRLWCYKPSKNLIIENGRLEMYPGSLGFGIEVEYVDGLTIQNMDIDGKGIMRGDYNNANAPRTTDSYVGIAVTAFRFVMQDCNIRGFWDYNISLGYGITWVGEDGRITGNRFSKCKHGVAGGSNNHLSDRVVIEHNTTFDANIEMHPQVWHPVFQYNTVKDIGASTQGQGIFCRGMRTVIRHNYIEASLNPHPSTSSTAGVYLNQGAGNLNYKIDSNTIVGFLYGIQNTNDNSKNGLIRGNNINGLSRAGSFGFLMSKLDNTLISGNTMDVNHMGMSINGAKNNSLITNNTINFLGQHGILLSGTSELNSGVYVTLNKLNASGTSGTPIRLMSMYDNVYINNNIITWPDNRFTTTNSVIYSENAGFYNCLQILNNKGYSPQVNTCPN